MVPSLVDIQRTKKYGSRASHLHHMTEGCGRLRIIPSDCHKLRDLGGVLDGRMSSLSTLAVRQFARRRAGVWTTQTTVERARLAVLSRIASSISTVILVNGTIGFHNRSHTRRGICSLWGELNRLWLDLQGQCGGIEQLFVCITHRHIQWIDSWRKGPVVVNILMKRTRNIYAIRWDGSECASICLSFLIIALDKKLDRISK